MILLRFIDEAEALTVLPDAPHTQYGTAIMRGHLGVPGKYVDEGATDEDGNPVLTEVVPPVLWPGYHVELVVAEAPAALMQYVVSDVDAMS